MQNNPEISVIVTTFNRRELLEETIQAILNQSFKDFELIIVDNFSNYNFKNFIQDFEDIRIRAFQNKNNGIIAINRNFGISKSKGKYIAFCDDDDIWLNNKLERQLKYISSSNYGMVFSMQKHFGHTNILSNNFGIGPLPIRANVSSQELLKKNCIALSSVILKKDILKESGVFDDRKSFLAIEDNDLWVRISKISSIGFIPEILVMHRNHPNNIYDNSSIIYKGMRELSMKNGFKIETGQVPYYKNNFFYFFLRNLFLILAEKLFYKAKSNF